MIRELHAANYYAYGYRRMWKALRRDGEPVGRDRVKRLMRAHGIQGAKRRGKPWRTTTPTRRRAGRPISSSATSPRQRPDGSGSPTSPTCAAGRASCSSASSSTSTAAAIVGWQFAAHMRTDLVLDALRMALAAAPPAPTSSSSITPTPAANTPATTSPQVLDDHRVLASIGSVGDAYDNAMAESFVDTFKTELIADRVWRTRTQLELAIVEYVAWFNHERLHERARRPSAQPSSKPSTLPGPFRLPLSINEEEEPTKPGLRETQPGSMHRRTSTPIQPSPRNPTGR